MSKRTWERGVSAKVGKNKVKHDKWENIGNRQEL